MPDKLCDDKKKSVFCYHCNRIRVGILGAIDNIHKLLDHLLFIRKEFFIEALYRILKDNNTGSNIRCFSMEIRRIFDWNVSAI